MVRRLATLAAAALVRAVPSGVSAAPPCDPQPPQRVLLSGHDTLESVLVDRKGHLYFTDADRGQLLRMKNRRSRLARPRRDLAVIYTHNLRLG